MPSARPVCVLRSSAGGGGGLVSRGSVGARCGRARPAGEGFVGGVGQVGWRGGQRLRVVRLQMVGGGCVLGASGVAAPDVCVRIEHFLMHVPLLWISLSA